MLCNESILGADFRHTTYQDRLAGNSEAGRSGQKMKVIVVVEADGGSVQFGDPGHHSTTHCHLCNTAGCRDPVTVNQTDSRPKLLSTKRTGGSESTLRIEILECLKVPQAAVNSASYGDSRTISTSKNPLHEGIAAERSAKVFDINSEL
ncbi:hypothetical protein RB195_019819 [Necator americanus]|uniref:Uncharacterized protein n=1 Tax=Necator americanus TaxID=51031 RepID=A0ABR1CFX1_NECAM